MRIIEKADITQAEDLLLENGILQVRPYAQIQNLDPTVILNFILRYGIYVLPTAELVDFLKTEIRGKAIEIGCGHGALGRALSIPITDSYLQETPEIKMYYQLMGQPTVPYPRDVEKLNAEQAMKKYRPDTVIGAYITHKYNGKTGNMYGVVEGKILSAGCKYINIGNDKVHADKPILKYPHRILRFDWLVTRSEKSLNHIKIWE